MSVPGSNLLAQALTVIAPQTVQYRVFISRTTNDIGYDVSTFADPVAVRGSFQPVPRSRYEFQGLDLSKSYWVLFAPLAMIGVDRDVSGDQLTFQGRTYQVESITAWAGIDGWSEALCCEVSNAG